MNQKKMYIEEQFDLSEEAHLDPEQIQRYLSNQNRKELSQDRVLSD